MLARRIARDMVGDLDQRQLDLQRRRAEQTGDLRLGLDLVGHQIEQPDTHRPDVLAHRIDLAHHHDAFGIQGGAGGKVVRNLDRHRISRSAG
jgi:hypothetical protein